MSIRKSDFGSIDTFFYFTKLYFPSPSCAPEAYKFQSTTRREFPCPLEYVIAVGF